MPSNAMSRETMRDRLVSLLTTKLVPTYAYTVSNGLYDGLEGQSPLVMVFSSGSRREAGGLGTATFDTWVRLEVQVFVLDAAGAVTQQDVEDTLDDLEKLIADVVADNRSDSGYCDYLRHAEEFTRVMSAKIGSWNYQAEIITLEALDECG